MEATSIPENNVSKSHGVEEEIQELVQSLPKECFGRDGGPIDLYFYQGFWCPSPLLEATISFQKHFQALDNDIFLTSPLKCGTTWMKALIFTIVNRHNFKLENNPLLTSLTAHQAVPYLEVEFYLKNQEPNLANIPQPRNPMDMFISTWHFVQNMRPDATKDLYPLDDAFDKFCRGIHYFGPFSDHVLGGGREKRSGGRNYLKELEVSKSGNQAFGLSNSAFFRKGEVGDSTNYLTPAMVERLEKSVLGKLDKSGLTFKFSSKINCE
ncbi:hypothetical protein COLO4_09295 [Corchorus olitorius]|uniref:Sulfotransferase n=1 Tax=Corchorus olitorius TaxID=93759 RepID=A0A1R3KCM0_9ROSI|nr:hypothetical protein COLO4_09295 [Corchorus olitorius]